MITIDPELEITLNALAEQEHISVNDIIKRLLDFSLKEKQAFDVSIKEKNTQQLMEMIRKIKPVKCDYSSEQIVRSLRDGKSLE